ncbi:DUF2187 family protein [Robertmurraya kyonggiensis]|uniref:DUF2187 family protein n=1 Tax=Robertmurraya kyonggiensis TaxID=1037680 RepID=UPI00130E8A49|nr:DUF2187 family protein [Robertmurraya kyonggiensis]
MNSQKASLGDRIQFSRNGEQFIGEVTRIREESVIVKLNDTDANYLKLETPLTVVSHKHYIVLASNSLK